MKDKACASERNIMKIVPNVQVRVILQQPRQAFLIFRSGLDCIED